MSATPRLGRSERFVFPDVAPLPLSTVIAALERGGLVTEHVEGAPPWIDMPVTLKGG